MPICKRKEHSVSRFPAELIVTLTDGSTMTEYFNQAQMAQFTRNTMLEAVRNGEPIIVFDGESVRIPAERIASVQVVEQSLVGT